MRNITKIFLLIALAFVVYLVWPRHPDLKKFNPSELARLELSNWQAVKAGHGFGAMCALYKIYTSQYGFAPIPAYRIAAGQATVLDHLKLSRDSSSSNGDAEANATVSALTEKYTWIKQQVGGTFDPDAVARDEFSWLSLEPEENSEKPAADSLSKVLAGLYGGSPADFTEVAGNIVYARELIFKDGATTTDGSSPVATAKTAAAEAYTSLKEIAATPITSPPAAQ